MAELFAKLLVSCPNEGGLFYLDGHRAIKLDSLDTTGLGQSGKRMLRGLQPDRVHVMDGAVDDHGSDGLLVPDVHDVMLDGGVQYLVGTLGNEVLELDRNGDELRRFTFPGEPDSWHLNCLVRFGGRVLFSAFGDYREHRAYKLEPIGSGFVQDLHTGERLIDGLSQPHSLVKVGKRLLLANSYEGELHEYDEAFRLVRKRELGGYARGILVDGDTIYVGLSCSRNRDEGVKHATLLALDAGSWEESGRLSLPTSEIYDVLKPKAADLPAILAMNASLASRVLSDRSLERERSLSEDISRLQERANDLEAQLKERIEQLQARDASADDLRRQLDEVRDELRQREVQWLGELQAKGAYTDDLHRQMDQERGEFRQREAQFWSELQARNASVEGLRLQLDQNQDEFRQREEQLSNELQAKIALADDLGLQLDQKQDEIQRQMGLSSELGEQLLAKGARISELNQQLGELRDALADREAYVNLVHASLSWQITAPLRACKAILRRLLGGARRSIAATGHVFQDASSRRKYAKIARQLGPVGATRQAARFLQRGGPSPEPGALSAHPVFDLRKTGGSPVVVLSTRHCRYVAELLVSALERAGIAARAIYEGPEGAYDDVPHFVICPQMFEKLPGLYVSFQMEQSVSTRWFTPDYLRKLENSFAIFDYSLENIAKLVSMGLHARQFYYMPVGYLPGYAPDAPPVEEDYDVLFYGDINNERRRACIAELEKVCRVKVVSDLFGPAMVDELRRAKVVVNIHYYPGALLESTRLWECLSLDCLVVSERSSDMDQHEELQSFVDFVDEGDFAGMAARVQYWLGDEPARRARVERNAAGVASRFNRFDYYFYRFLLASGNISFEDFWRLIGSAYPLPSDKLCLNLPEFTDRAASFDRDNRYGFHRFPGLRHSKGWIGCALSYKYMIRLAMERGFPMVCICEDDVEFPANFDATWTGIAEHLSNKAGQWHIFSGLMADLHEEAKILEVEEHGGYEFVTTNKLISTVFNVYDQDSYRFLTGWDETNEDVATNTIDRYLERTKSLRVLTTCPFLVGHKEELYSTLWGGQNTMYTTLIAKSESLLRDKIAAYRGKPNR